MTLRRLIAIAGTLLLIGAAQVAAADTAADWQSGQHAFANGDYESALLYFEMARDAGIQGPAVQYNVAVCQFKLGRYDAARESFRDIGAAFPKMRGLAEYNLGLVERRLGHPDAAREHFLRAWELSPEDEKIRALAVTMLEELEPESGTDATSNWYGSIGLRAGYDDNVALRDSLGLPAGVTSESPMADLYAGFGGSPDALHGLALDGDAYLVAYTDASDFDQAEFRVGGSYAWTPGDWRIDTSVHLVHGTLGGSSFEREIALGGRIVRYLDDAAAVELRYRYDDIDATDADYAGIAGQRQRIDLRYRWYRNSHFFALRFGIEANDRVDPGVSPRRNRVQADYRFQPDAGWGWELGLGYRGSDFDDLALPRTEDLATMTAAVTFRAAAHWLFALQALYSENDSNDADFSYDRSVITLAVMRTF